MRIFRNILCALFFFTSPAIAVEVQDLAAVREAVRLFVEGEVSGVTGEVEITVGQLDNRLRLARCESPLETSLPHNVKPLGNITVNVRCTGAKPWSLMVQAQIQQFIDVVVASRPLGRSLVLAQEDIVLAKTDISRLGGGYYATTQEVRGMVLKRSVTAGTVLTTTMLAPAIVIKRGEKVIISAESGSLQVRMEGEALGEGARGDLIEVRNLSSQQVIEAEVVAPGLVRVRM